MKEATGELNMTVVTVVAIAAVAAFFYAFVWPAIKKSIQKNTDCASAVNCVCAGNSCACQYYADDDDTLTAITCPNNSNTNNQ